MPGDTIELEMDEETFSIYLPTMAAEDITSLSSTEDTEVEFGPSSQAFLAQQFPDVDPEVFQRTQVTFAGSAQDDQGNDATQATIIPVDRIVAVTTFR